MGSEIPWTDERQLIAEVWSPEEIERIQFLRDGAVIHETGPCGTVHRTEFADVCDSDRVSFYHCRVRLRDGNLAVCSPVWVG